VKGETTILSNKKGPPVVRRKKKKKKKKKPQWKKTCEKIERPVDALTKDGVEPQKLKKGLKGCLGGGN